ncbi:MAG: RdgB/HAM1 family non-canonical purine NTP pyrophosphatase [Bacteroidia bacterium]
MELLFCSSNLHKVEEIQSLLPSWISVAPMRDQGITEEITEDGHTFVENALLKARYVHRRTGLDVFADDSGLEVESLGGAPGIYSARYAGIGASSEMNMNKLLESMTGIERRGARFVCVIALIYKGKEFVFEGFVEGQIRRVRSGNGGFGYDPLFVPKGYTNTFAELSPSIKNQISHRALAIQKMVQHLEQLPAQ